jgi:hypothetical protein
MDKFSDQKKRASNRFLSFIAMIASVLFILLMIGLILLPFYRLSHLGFATYSNMKLYYLGEVSEMTVKKVSNSYDGEEPIKIIYTNEVDYRIWFTMTDHVAQNEKIMVLHHDRLRVGTYLPKYSNRFFAVFFFSDGSNGFFTVLFFFFLFLLYLIFKFSADVKALNKESYTAYLSSNNKILGLFEYIEKMLVPISSVIMMCLFAMVLFQMTLKLETIPWYLFGLVIIACTILFATAFSQCIPLFYSLRYKPKNSLKVIGKFIGLCILATSIYKTICFLLLPATETKDTLSDQIGNYAMYLLNV